LASIGARPGLAGGWVHLRRTSSRCQRNSVCGVTNSPWRRAGGGSRPCGGEQRAVTRAQFRARDVAAKDLALMAHHEQLDVPLTSTVRPQRISSFSSDTNAR
jgi:hypothetical protein